MFNFFGGSTPILVPDNLKTGVVKHTRDEVILNDKYFRLAEHYSTAIIPARVRKPKDKSSVEMNVGVVERSAIAPLRNRTFMSLTDLNNALLAHVQAINERPFQKREGSRKSVFLCQEKDLLIPLPKSAYVPTTTTNATVDFNYHVHFDGCWYSVPFNNVRKEVEIVATKETVSIFSDGERIAIHARITGSKGQYSTKEKHMPEAHKEYLAWNKDRFLSESKKVGESCNAVMVCIFESVRVEQQAYKSAHALLKLRKTYSAEALEKSCMKALSYIKRPSYKTVKSIIGAVHKKTESQKDKGAYLRGKEYYENLERIDC